MTRLTRLRTFAAERFNVPEPLAPRQFRAAAILLTSRLVSAAAIASDQKIVGLARLRANGWIDVVAFQAAEPGSEMDAVPAALSFGPAVASLCMVTWLADEELEDGDDVL